jgi:hypothetical protein
VIIAWNVVMVTVPLACLASTSIKTHDHAKSAQAIFISWWEARFAALRFDVDSDPTHRL